MKLSESFFRKVIGAWSLLFFAVASVSSQVPAYLCELRNDNQVDSRTFEFDVYLLRTGATAFELSSIEIGINANSGLRNGGTITVTLVNGTSELNAVQIPLDSQFSFNNATNCIGMTASSLPGAGNGSVISGTGDGTRVGRIRLTNSATFGLVRPDLTWNFSSLNGVVTNVSAYVAGVSTDITVQSSHTISNLVNGFIIPPPAQFNVTGGGSYCSGGAGVAVGLSGSESGVTYTLILDGTDLPATVPGTGDAISFGNQTNAGTYTVRGTNSAGSTAMIGSVTVSISTIPGQPGVISGPAAPCPGTSGLTYEVAEVADAVSYTWSVPAGWVINSGQGTRTISVTSGTVGGTISVYGTNACGDGAARTLAVSVGTNSTAPTGVTITNNNTCNGISKVLTVSGGSLGSGAVWEWFSGSCGGTSAGTGSSITVDPAAGTTTNYYVRASGPCNTTACASGTVTVTANVGTPSVPVPSASVICQGTPSITVSTSAANATGYNWMVTGTGNTVTGTGPVATVNFSSTFSGIATISVTAEGCGGPSAVASITVTVRPTPTASISGSATVCQNSPSPLITFTNPQTLPVTITYNLNGSNEVNINVAASSSTSLVVPTTITGNYSYNLVRVTYQTAPTCSNTISGSAVVTVTSLPLAPVPGTVTQPTCSVPTGSVVLSGLPAAGTWVLVRSTGGTDITGSGTTYTVTGLPAGSHTFTVTNLNGCTSAASAPVVINTLPAVPTAPVMGTVTQPTCALTTGSVGISGLPSSGPWTLSRSPDGVEVSGTGTTFTVTGIPAGTFTYTVTNADGCISPASAPITITAPLPVPAAPAQTVDCSLGFNLAVITVTSPTGAGYSYQLDGGTFQTGTTFTNVANGTHRITVRNSSGCTTTGAEFSVNCGCVNPPLLTLSATAGSTCGVMAVTVTGNTFGGSATSVTITENGGGTVTPSSSVTSPFSFTYTPDAGDAGKVVVITVTTNNPLGGACTAASATYSLTVNANPVAPVSGTVTHPSCALPTGSVVLNSLPASGNWTVSVNPDGQTTSGSGTSTTISGLVPGTYTFTVTNALGCVSAASANVVINVQPDTPTAPVTGDITQPTCALSTGSVALSGLPAIGTWTLTRMPGNAILIGSGSTRTVSAIPPGTYTYTVANAAGCVSPASAEVVINLQPVTPSAPVIGSITHPTCDLATGSIVLENMPETGEWTLIRYPGGSTSTGTGSSATISSLPAGTYNFSVRNADGCTSPVSANAIINTQPPTPTAPVIGTITHPTFLVATGSVVLSGLPSTGIWTLIRYPDGFTSQGTGTTRTVSGLEPGTYNFAVTNAAGCTSANTGDVVINARPGAPVLVINNPPTICENETTDLTLPAVTAGSDGNLTFTYWNDLAATRAYDTPQAAVAGTYYIMGTSTSGYYTIKPVVVTADEAPVANAGPDQTLEYLFGTTLSAEIPEIGTGMWALISGTGDLFNATAPVTAVSGLSVGDNVFSWTVSNGACDPAIDLVVIIVNSLNIPTLITPNQDGRNDLFELRGMETLGRTELVIFDRRGLKVYENKDYQNDWDGTDYNSNPLADDTYFWIVRAENGVSLSGYIVVRR